MTSGEKLRMLRGQRSQQLIADKLNISKSAYAMYERDERRPRDEIKERIAKLFGESVQSIFYAS